jgi:hypothetical protein
LAKFTILIEPVNASPKDFPINTLRKVSRNLRGYLEKDLSRMLLKDMNATTEGWQEAPTMVAEVTAPFGTRLQLVVFPKGRGTLKWKRISEGTGPRTIRAKTPRGMRFRRDHDPKTTASGKYGGSGRYSGPWVTAFEVTHRIEPRKFSVLIMKRREKKIRKDVQKIVHKSGIR